MPDSQAATEPTISVIVPVRNMAGTVARTLTSIVDQKYDHLEIIVVDGRSTDRTLEEIKPFTSSITQFVSEPDRGLYDAVNKGLRLATGDIIGILNGDDYYAHPRVLDLYADKFEDPNIGIVFGDLEFFSPSKPDKTLRSYSSRKFTKEKLRFGWMPPHPTTFIRRAVYDAVGNYSMDYKISSDFEFLIRALHKRDVPFDRIDSVVVRMQYGGLSTNGVVATYQLNKEIIQACRANGLKTGWPTIMLKFPEKLMEFAPAFRAQSRSLT